MAVKRLDNVAIVVGDLDAAIAFFEALGLELEGRASIEGDFADQTVGLDHVQSEIAMMRTPDGHGRLELTRSDNPPLAGDSQRNTPPNTLGLHRTMFTVDDIDDVVARLVAHGGEVLGSIARYEDTYRLCYMRGPAGIIVALAQELQ